MNLKLLYTLVCLSVVFVSIRASETEEDLSDFNFDGEETKEDQQEDEYENNVDYEDDEEMRKPEFSKETMVRQVILNSMKTADMKDKVAKVLPILRVMTPDQKLALASLVTTQVLTPPMSKGLSLDDVSALFGNNPNTTAELMLPISFDIANLFRKARSEKSPTAEELRAPPPYKYRLPSVFRRNTIERKHNKYMRPRKPATSKIDGIKEPNCDLFSSGICLTSPDYPIEAIMSSLRRNKHAVAALLTDFKSQSPDGSSSTESSSFEHGEPPISDEEMENNEVRRTGADSGYMCPSIVRYARPQKARATSGQWKYIVNTADHTQTLRLERCLKPFESCTYLTDNFKSRCVQVYNYHRLLTWDKQNGLHMDIFKVPTCCSCHIDSYKVPFPPHHSNHATTSENFPGEDIDHEPSATTPLESDPFINHISPSNHYKESFPTHNLEYSDVSYQQEATKIRPSVESHPGLSKYLEAPKPISNSGLSKLNSNHNYKRSNTPKPFAGVSKRPGRPLRRRPQVKPVRDLAQSESSYEFSTEHPISSTTVSSVTKEYTRKINYNYHPIIDFFKPDQIESRMDVELGDSEWKPVTSMTMVTERMHYQK